MPLISNFPAGGGSKNKSSVIVTAPADSTVSIASSGGYGKTKTISTKNLLDIDAYKAFVGNYAINGNVNWVDDGLWLFSTGPDCYTNYGITAFTIPVKPNTKYTISWDLTGSEQCDGYVYAFIYSNNAEIAAFHAINRTELLTFTTPSGAVKMGFRFGIQVPGQDAFYSSIQIEEGDKSAYIRGSSCRFDNVPNGWFLITATKGNQKTELSYNISRPDVYYYRLAYFAATITITYPAGSACSATDGRTTLKAPDTSGRWTCVVPNAGNWTITSTLGGQTDTKVVSISSDGQSVSVALSYRSTPEFTYTGDCQIVQDNDTIISDFANWKGNWKIRFLTSGNFTVTNMHAWNGKIDVFLVGGGASGGRGGYPGNQGGGGSGYTKTYKGITIVPGQSYPIVIGAGGSSATTDGAGNAGGTASAFGQSANGGSPGGGNSRGGPGGNGGSGGSVGANTGGYDGSNGTGGTPGKGQGTTTREFGESKGKLYAAGGAGTAASFVPGAPGGGGTGGPNYAGGDGEENTGSGGGASSSSMNSGAGGSGIVIIRNAR